MPDVQDRGRPPGQNARLRAVIGLAAGLIVGSLLGRLAQGGHARAPDRTEGEWRNGWSDFDPRTPLATV